MASGSTSILTSSSSPSSSLRRLMLQPNLLPASLWVQVLKRLDYFDLCSMKRVNKLLNHCCKVREIEENLFEASYQESSIKSKFQAGKKKLRLHPIFSHCLYLLEVGMRVRERYGKDYHGTFRIRKFKGEKWKESGYKDLDEFESVIHQNATSPPVFRFRLFNRNWTTYELRDFRYHVNDRSRALDAPFPRSKVSSSTSSSYSRAAKKQKSDMNSQSSNRKAVTVGDILGALSVFLEKSKDLLDLDSDIRWENTPFSYGMESEEKELQRCGYCKDWHPHEATYYFDSEGEEEGDEDMKFDEETFCLVEESLDEGPNPLCSCWSCRNIHPWNAKCWERFIKIQEAKTKAARKESASKHRSCALVFCRNEVVPEFKLYSKGGLVADLANSLDLADFYHPEEALDIGPLATA